MKALLKKLLRSRFPYSPIIDIEISRQNLLQNLNEFRKLMPEGAVAPVLKSNAYGHGLVTVAKIIDKEKVPFIIIDSYFEALALRNENIASPLLTIGYTPTENIISNRLKDISFTVISLETLRELSEKLMTPTSIHLKIDTGMCRQGILLAEIAEAIELIRKNKYIVLEGIISHLADADNEVSTFTQSQIEKWNSTVGVFLKAFPGLRYYHLSNTAGHFYNDKIKANVSRLGLGLYGISQNAPIDSKVSLKPVLEMKTVVSGIKKIKKGERVGYSGTMIAEKDMTIATIPVGYFEGVDRRLSNKGFVKIGEEFAPIVGRVSMNITTIDVSGVNGLKVNDSVTVISGRSGDKNSVEMMAKMCETIAYEILVHVEGSLRRRVV